MTRTLAWMACVAGSMASRSNASEPTPPAKMPSATTPADAAAKPTDPVVAANHDIAFDTLRAMSTKPGNVVFSPMSLMTGLAMAQGGAGGATQSELTKFLRWTGKPEELTVAFANLSRKLDVVGSPRPQRKGMPVQPPFYWTSLNRVWVDFNLPLNPKYNLMLQRQFEAAVVTTDFKDSDLTAKDINGWVNQQTRGLISEIVEPSDINPAGVAMVNACYFKGAWSAPFQQSSTGPGDFTLTDGTKVQTPMMRQTRSMMFGQGDGWQSVVLPYKGTAEAVLIMPDAGQIGRVVGSLKAASFDTMRSGFVATPVRLTVPKFEVAVTTSVKGLLQSLGVNLAFETTADFTGISESPTYIGEVIHGAKLRFDEEGTEAAAATAVISKEMAAPPKPEQVDLTIDRPFVLLVRETSTGAILFAAKVEDPRPKP